MSKIFVTGYRGMIGSRLIELGCRPLKSDITDQVVLDKEIKSLRPDVIINCAAKTNVDFCEVNTRTAEEVNYVGARNVFTFAEKYNVPVVHISSDHVFSGKLFGKYKEYSEDRNPVNWYGFSKLGAEAVANTYDNVKIIRASSVISIKRTSLAEYILKAKKGIAVTPPAFLFRSFIHIDHFASSLIRYANNYFAMPKFLNIAGSRTVSWYTLVKAYADALGCGKYVHPRFFETKMANIAPRPKRVGLNVSKSLALGFNAYDYKDAVRMDV